MYINNVFRTLFLAILLQLAGNVHAASLDSLQQALVEEQDSSKRFEFLTRIVNKLQHSQAVEAMPYARQAVDLARALGDKKKEVLALGNVADIYFNVHAYTKTLEIAREMEQVALAGKDNIGLGNAYNLIGTVYHMQRDTDEALKYYEKALTKFKQSGKKNAHIGSLNNVAMLQIDAGEFETAEANLLEAKQVNHELNKTVWEIFNLLHLGNLEAKRKNTGKAWKYYEEGLALSDSVGYPEGRSTMLLKMVDIEFNAERFWEARQILEERILNDSTTIKEDMGLAYGKLANIYKLAGSFRKAYKYLEMSNAIKDSLAKVGLEGKIENIELANQLKVADRLAEIEQAKVIRERKNELENAKLSNYITLLMLLVVAALALGLLVAFMIKRRSNRELASLVKERTQALVTTNEELNTFMYRSSHEIRGAINSIQGLYDLAVHYPSDHDQVMELLGIKVMQLEHGQRNLIYTMELRNAVPNPVEVEVRKIVDEAVIRIKERRFDAKIDFRLEIPSNVRLTSDAWMLSIILENLLDNCVVFRDESQSAWCRVAGKQLPDGTEIRIEDNGIGIPPEVRERAFEMFFRGSLESAGSGLGLYNVHLAITKLGGTVTLSPKPGSGTLVVVFLPKQVPA